MTPSEARTFLDDNSIKFILAQFVDIHGVAKTKSVPAKHLDMILSDGAGFAGFAAGSGKPGHQFINHCIKILPQLIHCYGFVKDVHQISVAQSAPEGLSFAVAVRHLDLVSGWQVSGLPGNTDTA